MRTINASISEALSSSMVRGIYLVRLHFDAGTIAWHTGFGNITFESTTYFGAGLLGSISVSNEDLGIKASTISVTLSGVKTEVVALALGNPCINRKAYIHFVTLDENDVPHSRLDIPDVVSIAGAVLIFKGTMDTITGQMGSTAMFTVNIKSRLADWERPRIALYSDVEQQRRFPGDLGLEYVAQLSQKRIIWPKAKFLPDMR